MSIGDQLRALTMRLEAKTNRLFVNIATAAHQSITEGSPLTGAPGQPVDTGHLRASYHLAFESPTVATISTNVDYAEPVEDGIGPHGPVTYGKSGIGGSHSIKLTVAGIQRIADDELAKANA